MKYPAFSINSDTVHLTDNPLDDYQRLYLVSVLDRDSPPASFSAGLNIRKVNYKSSIAAQSKLDCKPNSNDFNSRS